MNTTNQTPVNNIIAKVFMAAVVLFSTLFANAQAPDYAKDLGTTSNLNLFGTTTRKTQLLYPAAVFTPAVQGGNITALYFQYGSNVAAGDTLEGLVISLGQTNDTSFAGTTFYTGLSEVLNRNSYTIPGGVTGEWFKIDLPTTFNYNPGQSLIVEVKYDANSNTSFGTYASTRTGKKLYATTTGATTGTASTTWQDFGFALTPVTGDDAGVVGTNLPVSINPGTQSIDVNVRNFSGNTLNAVTITVTIDSLGTTVATFGPTVYPSPIAPYTTQTGINMGSYTFSASPYTITAFTSNPNGGTDSDPSNDSYSTSLLSCNTLSGTYTINSAVGTFGTNFQTFTEVASALMNCGISGAVTFNVVANSGPYVEQISLGSVPGASATNTITINGNNDTLKYAPDANDRYIIKLDGTKHLTINNLGIKSTATDYGWGIHLFGKTDSVTINNCVIDLSAVTSTSSANSTGIVAVNSLTATTTSTGNTPSYLTITGNTVIGGYHGIRINGSSTSNGYFNRINNNTVRDFYSYGIYLTYSDSLRVTGNDISRGSATAVTTFYGIYNASAGKNLLIEKNRIHNTHGSATVLTGSAYGIYISTSDALVGGENIIVNNLIYNFNGTGTQYGFYNSGSDGCHYFHNTISFDDQSASPTTAAYGFYQITSAANLKLINNIISVTRPGTGGNYNVYMSTAATMLQSDYNVFFNSLDADDYVGRYNAIDYATLANWQTANTNAYDQNSTFANPQFANIGTGDLTPTNGLANDKGTNIGITTDYFGTARNATTPDAGAIEFDVLGSDAAIAYVSPVPPLAAGSYPITVNISNVASSNINSVRLTYTDGTTTVSQTFSGLGLAPLANQNLVFSTQYVVGSYTTLRVFIDSVDNQIDINQGNDTVNQNLCSTLAGTYTINQTLPTGSGNFNSFTAAVNAMILCGVSGPVTFNVTAATGPYNEQIVITAINGVDAVNTVTFNGNGNEISFDAVSADRYVIQLNGAKHYTFNDLVVKSLDATYGWGFHFINAADSNTVNNCTIDISSVTSTTQSNSAGIVASNSNTSVVSSGNNANYLTITGNTITGAYQSIYLYGSTTNKLKGNVIEDNTITDFYTYGIYLYYNDSTVIRGNDVSRPTRTVFSTYYGTYLSTGCEKVLIEKNRYHNPAAGDLAATDSKYGVYFSGSDAPVGSENRVINNLIYNFNGGGIAYGIYNSSSDGAHYYHNTISLDDQVVNTTSSTYGFYQTTAATNVKFFNNLISLTRNPLGTGSKWALYFVTTTGTIDYQSNNNVLYVPNAATYNVGRWSTDFATLAAWQTANSGAFDQNSRGNNPNFVDPVNFDFTPNSSLVNNIGTPLGVTDDINGMPRDLVLPDAGAIEFSVPGLDAGITLTSPSVPLSLGSQNVSVLTQNTQTTTITSIRIKYSDGTTTVSETFSGLNLATGDTTTLNFATPYNFASNVTFTVYIDSVNNLVDDDQANDTVRIALCSSLAGIYTIDSAQAVSATNYHSFQALANDLANCGISAPVTVQVASDTFTEQVVFSYVPGSSSVNRITFESVSGDSTQSVLSFGASSGSAFNYVVQMDGADYFTFRNMTISRIGTNQTYSRVIEILNESDYNIFANNVLAGPTGSTSTTTILNRTTVAYLSSKNDYNSFTNNYFLGNSNGMWAEFTTTAPKSMVTTINENRFENYYTGIFITAQVAPVITNNYLTRTNPAATSAYFGISVNFVDSTITITKNKVYAFNGGQNGIRLRTTVCNPATPGLIANNFAQTGGTGTSQGLSLEDNCENVNVYHNNVLVSSTSTTLGRALNIAGSAPVNLNFVNNVFANTGGGYAYYVPTASTAGVNVSDYNDLYSSGANIGFWGVAQATLADFQTASGKEANSVSADPLFTATDDLHVAGISLNNTATPLAAVTDDIDGETRSLTTPDIGADEFVPSIKDMTATGIVSPNGTDCGTVNTALSVVITNVGNIADDSVTVTVFVAGALVDTFSTLVTTLVSPGVNDTIDLGVIDTYNGGTYDFTVFTSFAGDFDVTNDTLFTSVTVNSIPADAVLVVPYDSVCFNSPASFEVSNPNSNYFYEWYDAPTGGNLLYTGASISTQPLTVNDTLYVEVGSGSSGYVGPFDNTIGATGTFSSYNVQGMFFTAYSTVYIDSVVVYPSGAGTIVFEVSTPNNTTVMYSASATVTAAGRQTIFIGLTIAPGDYRIDANGTTVGSLQRNSTGAVYPYELPGIIAITGNSFDPDYYYYFYHWKIGKPGCPSNGRTPAYAYVDSALTTPDAQFTYSANGLAVDFDVTTPATQGTTTWDFGGGNTASGNAASFTFAADGTYQVCADVVNPCGADNSCQSITVCEDLDSDFTYAYNPADSTATFTLGGTGTPTLTVWDFGDGGNSIQPNPIHQYSSFNNFTIKLYTQNLCGQRDTVTKVLSNCIPVDIDFTAIEVANGLDFNITTILTAGVPAIITYDLGDGNTSGNISFTHSYATYGNYTITLTATDACGNTDVATQTVSACEDVVAGFTSSVNGVSGNDISVAFTNQSTGNGLSYDWQFSDGSSSTDQNPVVIFAEGLYAATLTATNLCGETDVFTADVEACDVLDVNFTYTAVSNGLTIDFTNSTNSGVPVSLSWDFGDGNTGSGNNPSHTYAAEGFYDVTLTAVNACDDTTTVTQNINVITIGINGSGIDNAISVYPNPNNGLFNVVRSLSTDATTTVIIYNMLGEQVYLNSYDLVSGNNSVEIDISLFAAGVYNVLVSDKLGNKTIRLFKE